MDGSVLMVAVTSGSARLHLMSASERRLTRCHFAGRKADVDVMVPDHTRRRHVIKFILLMRIDRGDRHEDGVVTGGTRSAAGHYVA